MARQFSSASTRNVRQPNSDPPSISPWRSASKKTLRLLKLCLPLSATKLSGSAKLLAYTAQRRVLPRPPPSTRWPTVNSVFQHQPMPDPLAALPTRRFVAMPHPSLRLPSCFQDPTPRPSTPRMPAMYQAVMDNTPSDNGTIAVYSKSSLFSTLARKMPGGGNSGHSESQYYGGPPQVSNKNSFFPSALLGSF